MCRRWSLRRWSSRATKSAFDYDSALIDVTNDVLSTLPTPTSTTRAKLSPYEEEYHESMSVRLSIKFIAITIFMTTCTAFTVGCIARNILFATTEGLVPGYYNNGVLIPATPPLSTQGHRHHHELLPTPTIIPGKDVPYTLYTTENFHEEIASTRTVHIDRSSGDNDEQTCKHKQEEDEDTSGNHSGYDHDDEEDGHDEEIHLPAGQHLLIDIKDVDSTFLNSEERLATAMIDLINESQLTLLSYHCHSGTSLGYGVSCIGVLLESHIALHTWPLDGVIVMDLFTCGEGALVPLLPRMKELFGIPRTPLDGEDIPQPSMNWGHKLRGFRDEFGDPDERSPAYHDLDMYLGGMEMDVKEKVASTETAFQRFDVYDLMDPKSRNFGSYQKSLSSDGTYESTHPEQFAPDRVLFLDGVIQSTLVGDASYHESIVHPALITHDNPKRVSIIGGGEGATLREVLKHSTVEEAVMIEIDAGVVELSKEHLPQWQDCSSIAHHEGAAEWCFDDERVTAKFEDALAYFIDNFYQHEGDEKLYDIIIMDALDPNDDIPFAKILYTSDVYIRSLYNALNQDGILVAQVGEVPEYSNPADEVGSFANRAIMKAKLEEVGFKSIHIYEEAHSKFLAPWSTMVAFKDMQTRNNWYRNAAEIELQLQKRILPRKSGSSSLRNFDGATMSNYQLPSKTFEVVHCRQENVPVDCSIDFVSSVGLSNETGIYSNAYNPSYERHSRVGHDAKKYELLAQYR